MKQRIFAIFAVTALLLGMTGCSDSDDPVVDVSGLEEELVGLWWDEFEHSDVTENGKPFSNVLMAVEVNEDHTGSIYLGVFDGESEEPLEVYGGPDEAGFTWKLLPNGRILLGDPETGETVELARSMDALTRGGSSSYGSNMTNVSNSNMSYGNGKLTVTNGNTSSTLSKADDNKTSEIAEKLRRKIQSNVDLDSGGKTPKDFNEGDIR